MTKAKTTGKKFTLEDMKLFQAEEKDKLETLNQTGVIVEDVLSSIDFIEGMKDKGLDKDKLNNFKTVKREALKVKKALPVLIVFQSAFVKSCGEIIDGASPRKSRPSSKASRATTQKAKKPTTKKPTKGRAK